MIDQWFYQQCVAEVVGKLAAVRRVSGTVLDNTVILVCNDMSEGPSTTWANPLRHHRERGRLLQDGPRGHASPTSVPNNKLLTSILHAMGMADVPASADRSTPGTSTPR